MRGVIIAMMDMNSSHILVVSIRDIFSLNTINFLFYYLSEMQDGLFASNFLDIILNISYLKKANLL